MSNKFWDERYSGDQLVYGESPNGFLESLKGRIPRSGKAIDIGAGEGRNALFLASLGLDVLAIDQSAVGMQKAERLANERGLHLRTQAVDLNDFDAEPDSINFVSSIFVHLPENLRRTVHGRIRSWLKPGGIFVLEAYTPQQLLRTTGGPKDPLLLATLETIVNELYGLEILHQAELVRDVTEGTFHTGDACVVQIVARKV